MLPINKIYIDSRHKTPSSRSNSDFEIQFKEPINLPENCICLVSDVVMKNTLTTIEDFNNKLYVRYNGNDHILTINTRNYDIKTLTMNIVEKLNSISPITVFCC